MSESKRDIHISKLLSKILRHQAAHEGLKIDSKGFVRIEELLGNNKFKSFRTNKEDIIRVCDNNNKKRFEISEDGQFIRAVQGHSLKTIDSNEIYEQITLRDLHIVPNFNKITSEKEYFIIHGTSIKNYNTIIETGYLKKMNRTHVHFTFENNIQEDKVISGFRNSSKILIYINLIGLLNDPNFKDKVFLSKNKVILVSEDIPTKFIHHHLNKN
ncbi:phosphotransferase KptA/Tpt1 [Hanseniaspora valbyensis NRRL Y-1626]|uniref:2'-phosphotransferase n=1 Tax=Hanseniaspora valbyensis NRRL Y-1626 TaxID=766949 RepID=A0A1B7TAT5_9ASCO|nr:phosphotransferase KptA/Tpt1 [Hanseniaspora valbyensis NRRL Y-1626]